MGKYKQALINYLNYVDEDWAKNLFWKLLMGNLNKYNDAECTILGKCLTDANKDQNE